MLFDSNNFLKNFYFTNKKLLNNILTKEFENLNFIIFVGKDLYRRQIFLIDLDKLNFDLLENNLNALQIFIINCMIYT